MRVYSQNEGSAAVSGNPKVRHLSEQNFLTWMVGSNWKFVSTVEFQHLPAAKPLVFNCIKTFGQYDATHTHGKRKHSESKQFRARFRSHALGHR
jgi:hypothetical protein